MSNMLINPFRFATAPAAPSGPRRYWRVRTTANQGPELTSAILELEMYVGAFGRNRCVGGTPFADSSNSSAFLPPEGFDQSLRDLTAGSTQDLWASANTAFPHWLGYDFGAGNPVEIDAIGIVARQPSFVTQVPVALSVQYSDDNIAWTTKWSVSGLSWIGFEHKRFINPGYSVPAYLGSPHGAHTYWRTFCMRADNFTAPALGEMQYRATPAGADQATGGTPSASSAAASFPAINAFDDNGATLWSTVSGANFGWLRYQFAAPVEVGEVAITARADTVPESSPGEFVIQYSDDGITWTTAWGLVGETAWVLGETRVYTDPNYHV